MCISEKCCPSALNDNYKNMYIAVSGKITPQKKTRKESGLG